MSSILENDSCWILLLTMGCWWTTFGVTMIANKGSCMPAHITFKFSGWIRIYCRKSKNVNSFLNNVPSKQVNIKRMSEEYSIFADIYRKCVGIRVLVTVLNNESIVQPMKVNFDSQIMLRKRDSVMPRDLIVRYEWNRTGRWLLQNNHTVFLCFKFTLL